MADFHAIHSVGDALVSYLGKAFQIGKPIAGLDECQFVLLSSEQISADVDSDKAISRPAVSLYLYRVTVNEHLRNQLPAAGPFQTGLSLPLDLHYLVTIWGNSVFEDHVLLGWVMHKFHTRPMLGVPELPPESKFRPGDIVHVIPAELSNEDLMRIWEALRRPYTLSVSYIARAVRIDAAPAVDQSAEKPVIERKFEFTKGPGETK